MLDGEDDRGEAAGPEKLPGALEEKGLDGIGAVEVLDRRGESVALTLACRQRFEKALHAEGRIGDEEIEGAIGDLAIRLVLGDERVAVTDFDARLAIHECVDLRDLREAVFLFHAKDGAVVVVHPAFEFGMMFFDERLQLLSQLGEEVPRAAREVDRLGRDGVLFHHGLQRQAHEEEAADGARSEELPLGLLHALIEEELEHVAEELIVGIRRGEADVLPHLEDFQEDVGVLVEELFVVNVDEGEIVVREKFLLDEEVPDGALGGVGIVTDEAQRGAYVALGDVGDLFAEELFHAGLVELLEPVEELEVGVEGNALPVEFQVVGVLAFIDELAEKEVNELVKGVLATGDVVLAEDGGELVIFLLLLAGGDGVEIGEGVFVLADVIRLNVRLEDAGGAVVELVGVAPNGEAGGGAGGVAEAFERRVFGEIFFVVAMGKDVARVAEAGGDLVRLAGIEAEELRLADLREVGEELRAVVERVFPRAGERFSRGLALDDEERAPVVASIFTSVCF